MTIEVSGDKVVITHERCPEIKGHSQEMEAFFVGVLLSSVFWIFILAYVLGK